MDCEEQGKSCIEERLHAYDERVKEKARKLDEIDSLKQQITRIENEISNIDIEVKDEGMKIQVEFYRTYAPKDLLAMGKYIEKTSAKEHADDFKNLVNKFINHELEVNDISSLQMYFKLYGNPIKKKGVLDRLFKAFGGNLDD